MKKILLSAILFLLPFTASAAWTVSPTTVTSGSATYTISADATFSSNDEMCPFYPDGTPGASYESPTSMQEGSTGTAAGGLLTNVLMSVILNATAQTGTFHFVEVVRSNCSGDWYSNHCGVSYAATVGGGCGSLPSQQSLTYTPAAVPIPQWFLSWFGWF